MQLQNQAQKLRRRAAQKCPHRLHELFFPKQSHAAAQCEEHRAETDQLLPFQDSWRDKTGQDAKKPKSKDKFRRQHHLLLDLPVCPCHLFPIDELGKALGLLRQQLLSPRWVLEEVLLERCQGDGTLHEAVGLPWQSQL